jgi:glutathione synthase
MDPIQSIRPYKDSTFAMLLAAQSRGWEIQYLEQADLFAQDGVSFGRMRPLRVFDRPGDWFSFLGEGTSARLSELDVILMRKDPPLDLEYLYSTYLLEQAENQGTLIVNRCRSLRDSNEKLAATWFPECCPPTLVSRDSARHRAFLEQEQDVVIKPLDAMGGASIFRIRGGDPNTSVILETLTQHGTRTAMAQRYIPEIRQGDKRILLIDGEPIPYALARVPAEGELRGNLAAGAKGVGVELSDRDRWICEQVGPSLRRRGLLFVGLDVIGDYLTEVNVTSPTCIRELDDLYDLDIAGQLLDAITAALGER